jgi:hypothetical protein
MVDPEMQPVVINDHQINRSIGVSAKKTHGLFGMDVVPLPARLVPSPQFDPRTLCRGWQAEGPVA